MLNLIRLVTTTFREMHLANELDAATELHAGKSDQTKVLTEAKKVAMLVVYEQSRKPMFVNAFEGNESSSANVELLKISRTDLDQRLLIIYLFEVYARAELHGELKTIIDEWKRDFSLGANPTLGLK